MLHTIDRVSMIDYYKFTLAIGLFKILIFKRLFAPSTYWEHKVTFCHVLWRSQHHFPYCTSRIRKTSINRTLYSYILMHAALFRCWQFRRCICCQTAASLGLGNGPVLGFLPDGEELCYVDETWSVFGLLGRRHYGVIIFHATRMAPFCVGFFRPRF